MEAWKLGRALGKWNDRHAHHDTRRDASRRWVILDRLAGWLYVRG